MGRACLALGARPFIVDQKVEAALAKPELAGEARSLGIELQLGWEGEFADLEPDLLVINPAVPFDNPKLVRAISSGINAIGEIEFAYRISEAPIVAVTGTNGKSTTTVMAYLALRACGEDAILCGNIFGSGYPEMPLTEAAARATPNQVLVAEISSAQLELVQDFRPVSAAITMIDQDHLDRYHEFEAYAQTKLRIWAAQTSKEFAIVRANDPVVPAPGTKLAGYVPRHKRISTDAPSQDASRIHTFGATGEHARVEERDLIFFGKPTPKDRFPFSEPHNYTNACTAALMAYGYLRWRADSDPESNAAWLLESASQAERTRLAAKQSVYDRTALPDRPEVMPQAVIDGLAEFKGLANRMELVGTRSGIRLINNSMCTNPDALQKSAQAIQDPCHLLVGGVNKEADFRPVGRYLAGSRHRVYLFGRDARSLNEAMGNRHPIFGTMHEAFAAATEAARPGEAIMLAPGCASMDQFRDFVDRGNVFRQIAKDWLDS